MDLQILFTGAPNSGSMYAAQLCTLMGVPCGYQEFASLKRLRRSDYGTKLSRRSEKPADASWLIAPYLPYLSDKCFIVHLVRKPRHVVNSMIQSPWKPEVCEYLMEFTYPPRGNTTEAKAEWATRFWIDWNQMIDDACARRPSIRIKIETLNYDTLAPVLRRLGFDLAPGPIEMPERINGQAHPTRSAYRCKDVTTMLRRAARAYSYTP